ncbi:MAG: hypothetical protein HC813_03550 [Planctomycetes bacterium]|nr:hypothetical protein [Planctomycetota bacterium]
MSASVDALQGKKVRFFLGGGDRGWIQGPVKSVEGNLIYIEKDGEIRGTMHAITINADFVRYYEVDKLVGRD